MSSFHDFDIQERTLSVLTAMGITEPTPIQAQAIPALMSGKDVVGQSATGSGKTLAYGIPLVERISKNSRAPQALVIVPTRELAVQVHAVLNKLANSRRLATAVLVGGRAYNPQIAALRYGAHIVIGTPGRIKDHLDRGTLVLNQLRICILDEADQMLDSGFAPDIEEILTTTPETRQMALFSATMPDWVAKIQEKFLHDPVTLTVTAETGGQSTIEQIAYQVPKDQKIAALCTLLNSTEGSSSLIFGKTKFGVEKLGKQLEKLGFTVGTLHGDKSQRAREEVLSAFRHGQVQTLLATNVAARGLDIQGIAQVINYELPESSELFTHRIGRTGRMGRQGKAITLLIPSDVAKWRRMAHSLGQTVKLERMVIDLESIVERPLPAQPEIVEVQYNERAQRPVRSRFTTEEREERQPQRPTRPRYTADVRQPQRSARPRKPVSLEQERSKRPQRSFEAVADRKRRSNDWDDYESMAYERETVEGAQQERPFYAKGKAGKGAAGKQAARSEVTRKQKARPVAEEREYRTDRRGSRSTTPAQRRSVGGARR